MLGLPTATELNRQLPKTAIYAKFQMNNAAKERIDADISRLTIVNELSQSKTSIPAGETVKSFFVVSVTLKRKDFNPNTIATVIKLIPQNMLLVLEYGDEAKLAVYRQKLLQTDWRPKESLTVELKGLDLDKAWENIIVQVGGIQVADGNTLDEQISADEKRAKLQKEIDRLEKLARAEKQPKKKFEIVQQIKALNEQLKSP